jgi:hypothetical protein
MNNSLVDSFEAKSSPEFQSIIRRLSQIIIDSGHSLDADIKWGQLTFAQNADFHHWICAIKVTKKWVGLVFHFGGLLDDSNCVFKIGTSKFVRTIEYHTVNDIDGAVVQDFIAQALDRLPFFKANWKEIQKSA